MILTNIHWSRESLQEFIHKFPPKKYGVISYELWTITEVLHANMPCHHRDGILGCDAPKRHIFLCFLCDPVDRAQAMLNACYTYQSLACGRVGPTFGSPFHDGVCRSQEQTLVNHRKLDPFPKRRGLGLKHSLNSRILCLDNDQFERLLDVMSFFLSRTLFATNQMATWCFSATAPTEMAEVTMRYKMV